MSFVSHPLTADQDRAERRPILLLADLLMIAVMLGTLVAEEGTAFPLLNRLLGLGLVLLYVPCHFVYRLRVAPELWLFGLFIAWGFASGVAIAGDQDAFYGYAAMLTRFLGLALAVAGFTMAKRSAAMNFLTLAVLAVCLAIYARWTGVYSLGLDPGTTLRAGMLPWNQNMMGLLTLYGIMGLVYLWGTVTSRLVRLGFVPLTVALALTLVSSASRKSFAGLLAFVLLWLAFCYGRRVLRSIPALLGAALVVVGMVCLTIYALDETRLGLRVESAVEAGGLDETRTGLYKEGWKLFTNNPVAGVGLGNFVTLSAFHLYSHSDYMEALATTGLVGFVLYFSIYPILWWRIARLKKAATDPRVRYQLGVYRAIILTLLALGIGAPTFLSPYSWFLLASMIGHTWGLCSREPAAVQAVAFRAVPVVH